MKAARNSFQGGLKTDKDPLTKHKGEYVDALNIRLESDTEGSNYSVINIEGNEKATTIPDVPNILFLEPIFLNANGEENLEANWTHEVKLIIEDTVPIQITGNVISSKEPSWYVFFKKLKEELETNPVFAPYNIRVARSGLRISITSDTHNVLDYSPTSNFIESTLLTYSTRIAQSVIGWVHINDAFYIYTTNTSNSTGGPGYIWKLSYNKVTFSYTWKIIYASNDLKFTTQHPIPNPTGIEAIDEGEDLVRVAWTNNFNPLRFINLESPNAMAYTIGMLSVHDGVTNPIPTFRTTKTGGSLKTGVYQIAYRLRSEDTGYTLMSQHSSVINIVQDSEDMFSFAGYSGNDSGEETGKAIEFEFEIADSAYDYLEIFTLYRGDKTDIPEVRLITEIPIYNHRITHTITGSEEAAAFTYEEFLNLYNPFTHCKTIAQKDNILFAANVREDTFDVDFDPRAYGHTSESSGAWSYAEVNSDDQTLDAINTNFDYFRYQSDGLTPGGTGPNVSYRFTKREHIADTRESFHRIFVNASPSGISTTDMMRRYVSANAGAELGNTWPTDSNDPNYIAEYAGDINPDFLSGTSNRLGRRNYFGFNNSHASPWESANFRGYKRGEVYRFAFVPVKNGQEGRAKWIADIKIPHYTDVFPNAPRPEDRSFELIHSRQSSGDVYYKFMDSIGIEFTVDISSIASEIDGFKIKRVKREEADKTIIASGILGTVHEKYPADFPGYYMDYLTGFNPIKYGAGLSLRDDVNIQNDDLAEKYRPRTAIETGIPEPNAAVLYSPDINFAKSFDHKGGDKIRVEALMYPLYADYPDAHTMATGGQSPIGSLNVATSTENENTTVSALTKQLNLRDYNENAPFLIYQANGIDITDAKILESGASVELESRTFHNRSTASAHGGSNTEGPYQFALGAKGLAFTTSAASDPPLIIPMWSIGALAQNSNSLPTLANGSQLLHLAGYQNVDGEKYYSTQVRRYADYIRPLKAQYGGATYSARTKNKYIDCGNYIPVKSTDTVKTFDVYGGDTFISFMSMVSFRKNISQWVDASIANADPDSEGIGADARGAIQDDMKSMFHYVEYFPVESSINVDLRQGHTYDKNWGDLLTPGLPMNGYGFPDIGTETVDPNWDAVAWEGFLPKDLLQTGDDWIYNFAYSSEEDLSPSFPLPLTGEEADEFTERIYASDTKIKGEIINSWKKFRTQSFIDINGTHGPINAIINFMDRINAIQDRAIGIASVNERQVAISSSGESTVLGSSGVLPRYDYVSTSMGTKHQFGIVMSPNSLYFFDVSDGVLYKFTGDKINPISQVGEMSQFFRNNAREHLLLNDNPIHYNDVVDGTTVIGRSPIGITGTYDFKFNEVIMAFHNKQEGVSGDPFKAFTIVFNENGNIFSSFYSPKPTVFINDKENYFTPGPYNLTEDKRVDLYIHNKGDRGKFYDQYYDSYVEFIVNDAENISKIFTNLEWQSEVYDTNGANVSGTTVSSISTSNAYQVAPVMTTFQRRFRTWRATIPRESGTTRARLRDHYMKTKYTFNNSDNNKFVLSGVTTIYDPVAY